MKDVLPAAAEMRYKTAWRRIPFRSLALHQKNPESVTLSPMFAESPEVQVQMTALADSTLRK